MKRMTALLLILSLLLCCSGLSFAEGSILTMQKIDELPAYSWQKTGAFPDWTGRVDDTLAMNSMMSFRFYAGQGTMYLRVREGTESFSLYVNGVPCDTAGAGEGFYAVDFSSAAANGINTLQLTNIRPLGLTEAVTVYMPFPVLREGDGSLEGIRPEALRMVRDVISSDIEYGFTSAQLAVARNGRLVVNEAFGLTNSFHPDGTRNADSAPVTVDTLYDLASVTKPFTILYAVQKLLSEGRMKLTDKITEVLGDEFASDTLDFAYDGVENPPDYETQAAWKRSLTVSDVLSHRAGFPASPHYYDPDYDMVLQGQGKKGANLCYAGNRTETLAAIRKTPLLYQPGTKVLYSDVDYMLMTFVVERITGQRLDAFMRENFFGPLELSHTCCLPLENGFAPEDCAATELNGNTRDNLVYFEGIRTETLQGQVHDESAWYCMEGVSGHAGLFSNAADLAKLASLMLSGGYGGMSFFSRNVLDAMTAPLGAEFGQWGTGWWREGDDQRMWYYGTMADSGVIGHQGWTGTLVMIDPSRELVIVYLTNKINAPVVSPEKLNRFTACEYTASTLGFVPQILSIGLDGERDVTEQLISLAADMASDSLQIIPEGAAADGADAMNTRSKISILRKWAGDWEEYLKLAGDAEKALDALTAENAPAE